MLRTLLGIDGAATARKKDSRVASTNKRPGPAYDLEAIRSVFRLAQLGKKRAVHEVMQRLNVGEPHAEQFIRGKLASLEAGHYECTVSMDFDEDDVIADVYGQSDEHGGWYIKFYVEHGRVQLVSCHEPEHDMTCANGTVVKGKS